ncbi:hypothetical protein UlMin_044620 [Ulmus minor]
MKKASAFLKQMMVTLLSSIGKAKSRTSAVKARLAMLSLMRNKKVMMGSLTNKIQNLLGNHKEEEEEDQSRAIVLYNNGPANQEEYDRDRDGDDNDDDKYPDLTHSLFEDEEFDDDLQNGGSVIDMVRNSKEKAEDFKLEDEIDHVADLFIMKFHKQMRMQKLLSFKRYQDMLERSV